MPRFHHGRAGSPRYNWYQRWLSPEGYLGLELTIGFLIAFIGGFLFKAIADEVFNTPGIRSADAQAQILVIRISSPQLTTLMRAITQIGNRWTLISLSVLVGLLLLRAGSHRRLYAFCAITGGGGLLNLLLKGAYHRARPGIAVFVEAHGYSFPSGHSMGSMLFFGGLAYVLFFTAERRPIWRVIGIIACLFAVLLIGATRIYLGVHYLSDVVAGFAAGLAWTGICLAGVEGWIRLRDLRRRRRKKP